MAKRGPKPKEKTEISKTEYMDYDRIPANVYGKYLFTDLRTTVDFKKLGEDERCQDFTEENIDVLERQKRYLTSKKFDCDYNQSMRNLCSFKVMHDLYQVLWNIDKEPVLNSGETIISPNQAITRWKKETKKNQRGRHSVDWDNIDEYRDNDLDEFLHSIATIGNFIPVPSKEQTILNNFSERFDNLLSAIKEYFEKNKLEENKLHKSFPNEIKEWLSLYIKENGKSSWQNFVNNNFLKGSFVDENYNVVRFNNSLKQLSEMIYKRSVVMIEEYEKRSTQNKK